MTFPEFPVSDDKRAEKICDIFHPLSIPTTLIYMIAK